MRELINEFQDIFPKELDVRRPLKAAPVEIHTHHNAPIAFPNRRRYTADQMKAVSETLEKLLRLGIVERSMSAYNAPIVLVKKGKGYRMCHDFRRLNEATIPMAVTIPTVQDVFDRLPRAKFLSKIDCTSAYFQLQVAEKDRGKTAFTCHLGTFQYRVCPFGLKNLPAEFNSTISIALNGAKRPNWTNGGSRLNSNRCCGRTTHPHSAQRCKCMHINNTFAPGVSPRHVLD